jgi:hypothetical protein
MSKIEQIGIPVALVRCNHPHYCYEWDSMFICPGDAEFDACTCHCDGKPYHYKDYDKMLADFNETERLQEFHALACYLVKIGMMSKIRMQKKFPRMFKNE